jgi:uncharacterized membrane protein
MKRLLIISSFVFLSAVAINAIDIQSELQLAIDKQKKAADNAMWYGWSGLALTGIGTVIYFGGVSDLADATTAKTRTDYDTKVQSANMVIGLGAALLISGSVVSFLGWMDQLNANTLQSDVNAGLIQAIKSQ